MNQNETTDFLLFNYWNDGARRFGKFDIEWDYKYISADID